MYDRDLLLKAESRDECQRAGRALAAHVRADMADRGARLDFGSRVGLRELRAVGDVYGISAIVFGAAIPVEGELTVDPSGGLTIRVAHAEGSSRARFTVAHELGHAVIRVLGGQATWSAAARRMDSQADAEERICDAFAGELLFPAQSAVAVVAEYDVSSGIEGFARATEMGGKQWGVSVHTVLSGINRAGIWPTEVLAVIIRVAKHARTASDPRLRIVDRYPRPSRGWFVPVNRRVESVGLLGSAQLERHWEQFPGRDPTRIYRRSAVLGLADVASTRQVLVNDAGTFGAVTETLKLHRKSGSGRPWREVEGKFHVVYRYYASTAWSSYCAAYVEVPDLT